MKKFEKFFTLAKKIFLIVAISVFVLAGCQKEVEVTGVTLNVEKLTLEVGKSQILTATVKPNKATNKEVSWSSNDDNIVEVDATGKLTANAEGIAIITVTTEEGGKTAQCEVTVIDNQDYGPKAAYFGTWRLVWSIDGDDHFWEQITISANKIVWLNKSGLNCTISELTWSEINNSGGYYTADYPVGYKITGTLKATNGYNVPKATGNGNATVGDIALNCFYMSSNSQSIRAGNWQSADQEAYYGPYSKQHSMEYWQVTWNLDGGTWPTNDNHVTQVPKGGKLAAPTAPKKTNYYFGGWYRDASLINKVDFPYDVTSNCTLYAKWNDATPSATLNITATAAPGFFGSITIRGANTQYLAGAGTQTIKVVPGNYIVYVTYWACQTVNCMQQGQASFSISTGQTKKITIINSAISIQ